MTTVPHQKEMQTGWLCADCRLSTCFCKVATCCCRAAIWACTLGGGTSAALVTASAGEMANAAMAAVQVAGLVEDRAKVEIEVTAVIPD